MQNLSNPPSRSTSGQIDTKVSVPEGSKGKGTGLPQTNDPVKSGGAGGSIKGFSGGLINPKC